MKSNSSSSSSFFLLFALLVLLVEPSVMATTGGIHDSPAGCENSLETQSLGRFAVDDHNLKQNGMLEFVRVVEAREQVVAGRIHYLVLEAIDGGKKKLYEAKVWVKPWLNFKQVQEFKASDFGVKQGWRDVQPHDPQVEDAANHAVKSLQQRSNSLFPYQLQQIVHAKAQVIEEHTTFNMLLKLKRGDKEVKYRVEVHKNNEGVYNLNQMEVEN